jgi:endoglucanase
MTGADFSDKGTLEKKFLERTEYSRRTGTPIWVGEFGPILQDQPGRRAQRRRGRPVHRRFAAGVGR